MIEEKIDALIAALNANTAALSGAKSEAPAAKKTEKPAKVEKTPEPPQPTGPSMNDLRALAQKLVDAGRIQDVKDANKAIGVGKVSECPADKLAELHAKLNAAVDALAAA